MKLHFIITLLLITVISEAKVRNGYEDKIDEYRASYGYLLTVIESRDASPDSKAHAKRAALLLEEWIKYNAITENLLLEFKRIAPDIYNTMDTITDASGRSVDVYVKFMHEKSMPAMTHGTTNIDQGDDPTSYTSEYGKNTISIKVSAVHRALHFLAHEFGHAYYQVKNIATYYDVYTRLYANKRYAVLGHSGDDDSGAMAEQFEKRFMRVN